MSEPLAAGCGRCRTWKSSPESSRSRAASKMAALVLESRWRSRAASARTSSSCSYRPRRRSRGGDRCARSLAYDKVTVASMHPGVESLTRRHLAPRVRDAAGPRGQIACRCSIRCIAGRSTTMTGAWRTNARRRCCWCGTGRGQTPCGSRQRSMSPTTRPSTPPAASCTRRVSWRWAATAISTSSTANASSTTNALRMERAVKLAQLVREFHVGCERMQMFDGAPEKRTAAAAGGAALRRAGARRAVAPAGAANRSSARTTSRLVEATEGDVVLVKAPAPCSGASGCRRLTSVREQRSDEREQFV